ncbi:MAG: DEAD/DEAH box helicase family protein [Paracoccaceae bacterium]|nr:DEAD/DEAH box helicase family protein [Paracoccaceae bacterium]MDE2675433.1 DEAD/DEAH box helicase family protein [Paracoccaceae bacterium]
MQKQALTSLLNSLPNLSQDEKEQLLLDTTIIMRQCVDPLENNSQNTGLIIGYVQSGKTLSFTSLSALAHDNGYQIILLLAGTTNNLVEQSYNRLKKDLGVEDSRNFWKLFSTRDNGFSNEDISRVKSELNKWKRGNNSARTVLIVSMKQHKHLTNLAKQFANVGLSNVPTLIIDDEGDQAGMNTRVLKQGESTTYNRIKTLKKLFPHHSYLLYTATPQAPLLISRIDMLSADFGTVLSPGKSYVGGKEFFLEDPDKYINHIPFSEVPDLDNPPQRPPSSLIKALQDFFVGVAIGLLKSDNTSGSNRSMMIHSDIAKDNHLMYFRWVKQLKKSWELILEDTNHPSYNKLLDSFKVSYDQLVETYPIEENFDKILPHLFDAVSDTIIKEINTRVNPRIPTIDWNSDYSWILIGGIGLDRGFTVEGLTISYMPRSIGVGNSDSIQQRARFFGYKKNYIGLCRIYLTSENFEFFQNYVSHEESIRNSIEEHINSGGKLKDWRRNWSMDQRYRPTRQSVICLDMYHLKKRGNWVLPDYPYDDVKMVADNREVMNQFLKEFDFNEYRKNGWNEQQTIPAFSDDILLSEIIPFIWQIGYKNPKDNLQHSTIMIQLERLVNKNPHLKCSVYAFSGPWSKVDARRSLNKANPPKISQLFQGKNKRTNYPGARNIYSENSVTFQFHRYHLENHDKSRIILKDLPVLAVRIPDHLNESVWIEQKNNAS